MPLYVDGQLQPGNAPKLDSAATDGLAGTEDSLAYRVHEIERHFHNPNQCYGNSGSNNLERSSTSPFRVTASTGGAFGTELQIHDGTVVEGGDSSKKMDVGRFYVVDSQVSDETYIIEIWAGTSTFGAATKITEVFYRTGSNIAEVVPLVTPCSRVACNSKLWARCNCSQDSQWVDFMLEVHTYVG